MATRVSLSSYPFHELNVHQYQVPDFKDEGKMQTNKGKTNKLIREKAGQNAIQFDYNLKQIYILRVNKITKK